MMSEGNTISKICISSNRMELPQFSRSPLPSLFIPPMLQAPWMVPLTTEVGLCLQFAGLCGRCKPTGIHGSADYWSAIPLLIWVSDSHRSVSQYLKLDGRTALELFQDTVGICFLLLYALCHCLQFPISLTSGRLRMHSNTIALML